MTYKLARRIVVFVIGIAVCLAGVVMLVTPGPGLIVIPAGLAILSIEFDWARLWLRRLRERISLKGRARRTVAAQSHRERVERH